MKVYEIPLTFAKHRYPRPRYQVSVYRTIGPLVQFLFLIFCRQVKGSKNGTVQH